MKNIPEYEGIYAVEEDGRVWSYKTSKYLRPQLNNNGYYRVCMYKDNICKNMYIHKLVALTYISNPDNKPYIDHIDRNRTNNSINNLRWVNTFENAHNLSLFNTNTTGEKNIFYCNTDKRYKVSYERFKNKYRKSFKTLEEAIAYRNEVL